MKPRFVDLLVCPVEKTSLELVEWETVPVILSAEEIGRITELGLDPCSFSREILTGALVNRIRKVFYPIYQGVPRMLISSTGLTREFAKVHAERIARELPGFTLPHEMLASGEEDILRSFSKEWLSYDWNPRAYWSLSPEDMYRCMRFMLDLDRRPVKHKLVLEMGIGIGGIADYIVRSEECEMVGADLGYAVDAAQKYFGQNPMLHIVQASVFAPPLRDNMFDFVYSQGVIHHTYSPRTAFDQLAKLPKIGGRLYIWVYSLWDYAEDRTWQHRILMKMERIIRPLVWRLPDSLQTVALAPIVPLYLAYENGYMRNRDKKYIKYGWREAMHAARDRFTPRYAHRHTEEEVCGWFREAGYPGPQCASKRKQPDFVPIWFVRATAVDGVRGQV
jgi:uncharacterized protein YbaR (Trm112 family)/SAM-dependent methyltransferase